MRARRLVVSGIVQGVGFRWFTERAAQELGVVGWVRNLHDGRVEVWAEGPEETLDALEARCRSGPPGADVQGLLREDAEPVGHEGFEIRRTR